MPPRWMKFVQRKEAPRPEPTMLASLNAVLGDKEFHAVVEVPAYAKSIVVWPTGDEGHQYRFVRRDECVPEGDRLAIVFEWDGLLCP